jgi:hypothetical protein
MDSQSDMVFPQPIKPKKMCCDHIKEFKNFRNTKSNANQEEKYQAKALTYEKKETKSANEQKDVEMN